MATLFDPSTRLFDCLVGHFYLSGFHLLYPSLARAEKIRILIGLETDSKTFALLNQANEANKARQSSFAFQSQTEIKEAVAPALDAEFAASEDGPQIESGARQSRQHHLSDGVHLQFFPIAARQ